MFLPRRESRRGLRVARPRVEGLEGRLLLYATTGDLWSFGSRITYSFAPDGTNIGGEASNLNADMGSLGISTSQWQAQFEKAAAVWQSVAGVNLTVVGDSGDPFGTSGNQQDDPRFGDIRIGGQALASNVLASCFLPPPDNGGTLAGDIVFNTRQPWQVNNTYDIETVAIHEFGHALGMGHSAMQQACMFAYYTGTKQALTSDDTQGIQSIYGARQPDSFDAVSGNNTLQTASNINGYMNGQGQISLGGPNGTGSPVTLDIASNVDSDFYAVTAPANTTGTLTVTMQSDNLSSLDPKLIVYNSANQALGTAAATYTYGGTIAVTVTGVTAGATYKIKCMAADSGPSGTGGYGLLVNFSSKTMSPVAPPNTIVAQQPDQGGGSANELIRIGKLDAMGDALTIKGGQHSRPVPHALHVHDAALASFHGRRRR